MGGDCVQSLMQTHHLPFGGILIYLIIQILYNKLIIIAEFPTNGVQLSAGRFYCTYWGKETSDDVRENLCLSKIEYVKWNLIFFSIHRMKSHKVELCMQGNVDLKTSVSRLLFEMAFLT